MRGWTIVVSIAAAACGRVGFDEPDANLISCESANPPISSLVDDFSDGMYEPNWTNGSSCMTEVGGEMVANVPANDTMHRYCILGTLAKHSLACDAFFVHVAEATTATFGAQTALYVSDYRNSHEINFLLDNGGFAVGIDTDPATIVVSNGYDATADAWWRVRGEGGHLYFDTSPDGASWAVRLDEPYPYSLDEVGVTLGAGTYAPVANPGVARFRNFNLPP
jgi:hypothetical protein